MKKEIKNLPAEFLSEMSQMEIRGGFAPVGEEPENDDICIKLICWIIKKDKCTTSES